MDKSTASAVRITSREGGAVWTRFEASLVSTCIFGMFVATGAGQVRLFMAADGEQSTVATTGNTHVTMFPGTSKKIMAWLEDTVQNQEFSFYQVIQRWDATPQPGAIVSISYRDISIFTCGGFFVPGEPCDPVGPSACAGFPQHCHTRGATVFVDTDRSDYVFAQPTENSPGHLEIEPPPSESAGFGFVEALVLRHYSIDG